jgi:prepilin-type N-terminal cleavage/methylation domain-containing protein
MTRTVQRSAGFTLIELMVVVAIMTLVLGWGLPNMLRTVEKQGINKAVTDLMEGCKQARAYAILTGEPSEFVIRAEDGQMTVRKAQGPRLMRHSGGDAVGVTTTGRTSGENLKGFNEALEDDVAVELLDVNFIDQMEFSEGIVRFYPNGTSDEFTIVLRVEDEWRKVSLDPITGIANMEDLADYR